jgi:hypothetical protein
MVFTSITDPDPDFWDWIQILLQIKCYKIVINNPETGILKLLIFLFQLIFAE